VKLPQTKLALAMLIIKSVIQITNQSITMTKLHTTLAALALVAFAVPAANAATITTLYNTGVDALGNPLAEDAVDSHYTVTGGTQGPQAYATTSANGWPVAPFGPWLGDNTSSTWLTPTLDSNADFGAVYTFTTTFDLTGLDPLTAVINGMWAGDDGFGLSDIILNGVPTGQLSGGFTSWTPFSLTSGFVPGINTLSFQVENSGGGPTGVRVEMRGSAVPDGGTTVALFGLGLMGVATLRRRFNSRRAL